ncbi:MAG: DUF5615 family PIN-like protein [Nitrospirae bacterium]|nr:DUF5615 family PIN-like protein [Nitrospirota bacterium]
MNILLDESAPRLIKTSLPECSISTVQEMGWAGLKNGELLALAEKQFDVFITADKQLRYQQNLTGRRLAVIVLPSNQVPAVIALLPAIRQAIERIQPGTYEELTLP